MLQSLYWQGHFGSCKIYRAIYITNIKANVISTDNTNNEFMCWLNYKKQLRPQDKYEERCKADCMHVKNVGK
jgi:AAA15 family ATPase/GTPase